MRLISLFVALMMLCSPLVLADGQVYVKADAQLEEKVTAPAWKITEKMKTDVLKMPEITVKAARSVVQGNTGQAKQVIEQMVEEGLIKTERDRYSELFPSAEITP